MTTTLNLNADDPFLRIGDVEHQTGLKKSTIYKMVHNGDFPPQIRLGGENSRASGWLLSEINQWKRERIAVSRGTGENNG